jgi:hypothetical protein
MHLLQKLLQWMVVEFTTAQSPCPLMQRSCTRLTSTNGELELFNAGLTSAKGNFGAPDILCMITYANRAVGNLRSQDMMYHIILLCQGYYVTSTRGQGSTCHLVQGETSDFSTLQDVARTPL